MIYTVTGYLKFNDDTSFDQHEQQFSDYNKAVDCYTQVFGDVAKDISQIGGEFVLMLTKEIAGVPEIVKRHTINTTFINA